MPTPDLTPAYVYVVAIAVGLFLVWLMYKFLPNSISNYIDSDLDIGKPKGEAVPVKAHLPDDEALITSLCNHMSQNVTIAYGIGPEGMDWTYRFTEQDLLRTIRAWHAERNSTDAQK